jgi:predicted nucleotidyltransferase
MRNAPAPLVLPVGTQVVTRVDVPAASGRPAVPAGAVGVIVTAPPDGTHAYRIRLVDGSEIRLRRGALSIRKDEQRAGLLDLEEPGADVLQNSIVLRVVIGSRAYGLDREASDTDRRGVFVPPADLHWSLAGVPEQIEWTDRRGTGASESQECYWEIGKCLRLALKANPNVLECLYSPLVEFAAPLGRELLELREAFLSRLVYQTYNGYVLSQFRKLEQDCRRDASAAGGDTEVRERQVELPAPRARWKHAMHLVRLLLSGITVLREGFVPVRVDAHRDRLLAVRDGAVGWEEVNTWRLELHRQFDAAFAATRLPERPDYRRVDAFLIRARRSVL